MTKESTISEKFRKWKDKRIENTIHQSLGEKYMIEEYRKLCNMNGIEMSVTVSVFEYE